MDDGWDSGWDTDQHKLALRRSEIYDPTLLALRGGIKFPEISVT